MIPSVMTAEIPMHRFGTVLEQRKCGRHLIPKDFGILYDYRVQVMKKKYDL